MNWSKLVLKVNCVCCNVQCISDRQPLTLTALSQVRIYGSHHVTRSVLQVQPPPFLLLCVLNETPVTQIVWARVGEMVYRKELSLSPASNHSSSIHREATSPLFGGFVIVVAIVFLVCFANWLIFFYKISCM